MSLLIVPLVRQETYSADCGIACVAMILEYYGIPYVYAKVKKEIGVFHFGTFMPQLGLYLLKTGFRVEIVTMHPALFTFYSTFTDIQELINHLKGARKNVIQKKDAIALDFFITFVRAGGVLTPRIPTVEDICEEIDQKRPLFSSLTHRLLFRREFRPRYSFHFNVVTGYDSQRIYVNDPDWGDFGGVHKHDINNYLYAIYANVYGFIDGGSIMKVTR